MRRHRAFAPLLAALLSGGSTAAAEPPFKPIPAYSPEAQAVREAAALKKEGTRLFEEGHPGEAREKWLAAVAAYQRSGYKPGESEALIQLGVSYQPEIMSEPEKMKLMSDFMRRGALVSAEFLEDLTRQVEPVDRKPYQEADALLRQASDIAQSGDCASALPVFEQAGQSYGQAAFPAGELRSLIGRLRCPPKDRDPLNAMSALMILPELNRVAGELKGKVVPSPFVSYLRAVEEAELGEWKDSERLLRQVLQEDNQAKDVSGTGRAALDLGCVLVQTGRLKEAEPLFQQAQELLAGREDADSRRNRAAALQNLAGLQAVAEKPEAPGEAAKPNQANLEPPSRVTPSLADVSAPEESLAPGPILARNARAHAQRQAVFLLGEGDHLQQAGNLLQAREKWKASAEAYKRAEDGLGEAEAYSRLADSFLMGGITDPQKFSAGLDYYLRSAMAGAAVYETLIRKQKNFDEEAVGKADALLREAQELARSNDYARALPLLAEARSLYHGAGFGSGEARALLLRANCQAKAGDLIGAFNSVLEALPIAESLPMGDSTSELAVKAEDLFKHGRWQESLAACQELLCRYEEAKDLAGIAGTLLNLGAIEVSLGRFAESEEDLRRALRLFPQVEDEFTRSNEAAAHQDLGAMLATLGRADEAAEELRIARALWRETGEPKSEVASLSAAVLVLGQGGDFAAALATLDEAEDLQQHLPPEPEIEGDLLNNRAVIYFHQGRYPEALDLFQRSLVLRRRLPQPEKAAETLINISSVQIDQGRLDEALATLRQVEEIARQRGSAELAIKASLGVAGLHIQRGNYQEGIRIYLGLLNRLTERGDLSVEAVVHTDLGAAYLRLGDLPNAQGHFTRALEVFRQIGNPDGVASALLDLGGLRARAGDPVGAGSNFDEARRIWSDLGNRLAVGRALADLAGLAAQKGDSEEALKDIEQAREQIRNVGAGEDEERLLLLAGGIQLRRGDPAKALDSLRPEIDLAGRIGDPVGEFAGRALTTVARFLQGDLTTALVELDGTMALLDRWGAAITVSELKSTFLDQFFDLRAVGVLLNFQMNRPAEAFRYAEQARARAFLNQLANQRITPGRGSDPELIRKEQDLRVYLSSLREALHSEMAKPLAQSNEDLLRRRRRVLDDTGKEYAALLVRLKLANPDYAGLISVNALSLPEVQREVLDEQTTLIEYFVPDSPTREGGTSRVLAWVIDRDRFSMVQLPVTAGDLKKRVAEFRNLIGAREDVGVQASELYRDLFAPLVLQVRHRNLIIVPHGTLHFLPFASLWDDKRRRYLGDSYALSFAPSATALKLARQKKARAVGPILVAGNPDGSLPDAAAEAIAVARLYGSEPLLGRAATKSAVVARAGKAGIVHLAAHADLNQVNPLFTRIRLASDGEQGGDLEMHEVFDLDLSRTGLVVLSACRTQLGTLSAGDELEGLTRAFLYAGTPAVMSSLWNVEDGSTAFLMTRFYTHLRQGAGRAESLRLAQMETRKRFPHPYQWAAFVLTGDGR